MAEPSIKLLGLWASPFTTRARIALNLKLVDYQYLEENLGAKSELLLKSNPVHQKVPVLLHDEKAVCESLIIIEYIDEAWSARPSILPTDPYERSIARFWAAYIEDKWFLLMKEVVVAQSEEETKVAVDQVVDLLLKLEDVINKLSKGNAFFGRENIGYLDIVLGAYLGWVRVSESMSEVKIFDEAKTPSLAKWAHVFMADAAVKDVMPEIPKLMEYAKVVFARMKAAAGH